MILWCHEPPEGESSVDISVNAGIPWNQLSADYQHGQIPVPGVPGMFGETVTGIMEALKLIGPTGDIGRINPGYFVGPGRSRSIKNGEWFLGYNYRGRRISLSEANRLIMIPCYTWLLENKVYDIVAALQMLIRKNKDQHFWIHDGVPSDIPQNDVALSAAAILVTYLNGGVELFYQ